MKQWCLFKHNVITVWLSFNDNGAEVEYKVVLRIIVQWTMNIDAHFPEPLSYRFECAIVNIWEWGKKKRDLKWYCNTWQAANGLAT